HRPGYGLGPSRRGPVGILQVAVVIPVEDIRIVGGGVEDVRPVNRLEREPTPRVTDGAESLLDALQPPAVQHLRRWFSAQTVNADDDALHSFLPFAFQIE